ncbi:MAG: hypothetical protein ACM3OO_03625 [Planctomycetaceae bacterium]
MLAIDAWIVLLRVVHIVSGVIWVGSLFVVAVFVQPIAAAVGPPAGPFMAELRRRRLVDVILVDALITIAAGSLLYWHDWHLLPSFGDWIGSAFGATLTVGALLAISVIPIAALVTRPTIARLVALGRQAAESGGPSPELAQQIAATQRRLAIAERSTLVLALLAVAAMASARYV